jgi:protein associated with RNAse G/E
MKSIPQEDRPRTGDTITVHKLDAAGNESWRYAGEVLRTTPASITLVATFDREDRSLGGIKLQRGDRFVETFYSDRWYNVFRIHNGQNDHLKGWYCNITRPAQVKTGHIYADDLALDLVVLPNGTFQVLDEDEFEALRLSPDERETALEALEELQALASSRAGVFQDAAF